MKKTIKGILLLIAFAAFTISLDAQTSTTSNDDPLLTTYSQFDFIPGEKVVFFDDFSGGTVGDFPVSWNTNGSGEIVTTNLYTGKWFNIKGNGCFVPEITEAFPENFTVEFDVLPIFTDNNYSGFGFFVYSALDPNDLSEGGAIPGVAGIKPWFGNYQHDYNTYADGNYILNGTAEKELLVANKKARVSIWVQKQRIRIYINETKIFDLAKGMPTDYKYNVLRFEHQGEDGETLIGNFRVAVGAPDIRSKLITDGKLVSYGIYFDSGKDVVKGESYGSLKEIAAVLTENPTVKIKIVGYTDSDGDDATNLELSKKRAIAVKASLNKEFGIDNSRMETDGKGEAEPIAPNTTSEGKAKNRRVEFIKL